ncbi:MAG: DUF4412 domain-containing protein [Pseudomonadota bacterium]
MKKFLFVSSILIASSAIAGVRVESVTRDIKTQAQQGEMQTVLLQNGMVRVKGNTGGSMILKGSSMIIIDDKKKQYREMSKEDMKKMANQAGAVMSQMQERMKNMTPEQRAMMEKMMGNQMPGGAGAMGGAAKADVYAAKDLGKSATVEGRKCQLWSMSRNGKLAQELCVVPFNSLPGNEDFAKAFKELAEAFADMASAVPGADQTAKAYAAINGYPVRTRYYESDGKFRATENVMTKWVAETLPASTFEVPAGYKKMEMPKMGVN